MRAGLYARVSTHDQQTLPMQIGAMRDYATRRGWEVALEVQDVGSGASLRPRREELLKAARRRDIELIVVWRLDRLGRNLRHLVTLLEDVQALGIAFVSLAEGIDATTPAGKLQMHILAAIAEFERARIAERVRAGLARVRAKGQRLGRRPRWISDQDLLMVANLSTRKAAVALGVPPSVLHRARVSRNPVATET